MSVYQVEFEISFRRNLEITKEYPGSGIIGEKLLERIIGNLKSIMYSGL